MLTAAYVYDRQGVLAEARARYEEAIEVATDPGDPEVAALREQVARLAAEVTDLQGRIGGVVYRPATVYLPRLQGRIQEVQRRARRTGTGPVELTITDERVILTHEAPDGTPRGVEYTYVILRGETPRLAGWRMVAILDHTTDPGDLDEPRVVIRRVPGQETVDLTGYRHAPPRCDYCQTVRRRAATYVVANDAGQTRQVGSDCLRDFVGGIDPHDAAALAEHLAEIDTILTEPDEEFTTGLRGGATLLPLDTFVAVAATLIRVNGYRPRWDQWGVFNDGNTADLALEAMSSRRYGSGLGVTPTQEDRELATAAIRWAREDLAHRETLSEFESNLVAVAGVDWLSRRHAGIAAYLPCAYERECERERARREAVATSRHVGQVGERIALTLTVTSRRAFDGTYGVRYLIKLTDEQGNRFLWWSSRDLERGRTYTGKATVTAHDYDQYEGGCAVTEIKNFRAREVAMAA